MEKENGRFRSFKCSKPGNTLKVQLGGVVKDRKNSVAEVDEEGGAKPEEECGKRMGALSSFQVLKNKHMCKKIFGSVFPNASRSNLKNRRFQ